MSRNWKHVRDIIEKYTGYYTVPFSFEPFEGQVICYNGDELNVLFQRFWDGDEYSFREKLHKMDEWFVSKPPHIQDRWERYVPEWLQR